MVHTCRAWGLKMEHPHTACGSSLFPSLLPHDGCPPPASCTPLKVRGVGSRCVISHSVPIGHAYQRRSQTPEFSEFSEFNGCFGMGFVVLPSGRGGGFVRALGGFEARKRRFLVDRFGIAWLFILKRILFCIRWNRYDCLKFPLVCVAPIPQKRSSPHQFSFFSW